MHDEREIIRPRDPYHEIGMDQPQYNPKPAATSARDPIALAGITVQAVDQIGDTAAAEIEAAAAAVERDATEITRSAIEIAQGLRELAEMMRERSQIASGHVDDFCKRATSFVETMRGLQRRLGSEGGANGSGEK